MDYWEKPYNFKKQYIYTFIIVTPILEQGTHDFLDLRIIDVYDPMAMSNDLDEYYRIVKTNIVEESVV